MLRRIDVPHDHALQKNGQFEGVVTTRVAGFKKVKDEAKKKKRPSTDVPVTRIRRNVLHLICEVSKENFPNEFSGQLRAQDGTIHELTLLPGTKQGRVSALVNLWMMPIDYSVVGSVHSHPSGNYSPSDADLEFFRKFGAVHIIIGKPYTLKSWQAYDYDGNPMTLEIVD